MESLRAKPEAMMGAAVAFGFGAGGTALLGASAFAKKLFVAFTRRTQVGSLVALPIGLGAALVGCGAYVYAKLPWYSLAILAAVPLVAHIVWFRRLPRVAQAILSLIVAAVPAGAAAWFTLQQTGAPPL